MNKRHNIIIFFSIILIIGFICACIFFIGKSQNKGVKTHTTVSLEKYYKDNKIEYDTFQFEINFGELYKRENFQSKYAYLLKQSGANKIYFRKSYADIKIKESEKDFYNYTTIQSLFKQTQNYNNTDVIIFYYHNGYLDFKLRSQKGGVPLSKNLPITFAFQIKQKSNDCKEFNETCETSVIGLECFAKCIEYYDATIHIEGYIYDKGGFYEITLDKEINENAFLEIEIFEGLVLKKPTEKSITLQKPLIKDTYNIKNIHILYNGARIPGKIIR